LVASGSPEREIQECAADVALFAMMAAQGHDVPEPSGKTAPATEAPWPLEMYLEAIDGLDFCRQMTARGSIEEVVEFLRDHPTVSLLRAHVRNEDAGRGPITDRLVRQLRTWAKDEDELVRIHQHDAAMCALLYVIGCECPRATLTAATQALHHAPGLKWTDRYLRILPPKPDVIDEEFEEGMDPGPPTEEELRRRAEHMEMVKALRIKSDEECDEQVGEYLDRARVLAEHERTLHPTTTELLALARMIQVQDHRRGSR
jgi:hypothetical protein